jgi:hypothetical protein
MRSRALARDVNVALMMTQIFYPRSTGRSARPPHSLHEPS